LEVYVAVRRGIWIVITLILVAVAFSAAGLVVTAFMIGRPPQVPANSTLVLRLTGDLRETEPGGLLGAFTETPPTVRSVVDALRKAKVDRRVTGVVIRPAGSAALWGKVQEVRDAILDFKTADKPIVAFLEQGGDQEFYLASTARCRSR
jgi:protease-4